MLIFVGFLGVDVGSAAARTWKICSKHATSVCHQIRSLPTSLLLSGLCVMVCKALVLSYVCALQPSLKQDVGSLKEHARNIIDKCLTETQKLHIGTTVIPLPFCRDGRVPKCRTAFRMRRCVEWMVHRSTTGIAAGARPFGESDHGHSGSATGDPSFVPANDGYETSIARG
eukprot:2204859-Rhodomonas_salina.3